MNTVTMSVDKQIPRFSILGVNVSALTILSAVAQVDAWVSRRESNYVCVTGVHGLIECQDSPDLMRIHNAAGLVTPDGMPLVWFGRAAGYPRMTRVYGPDLMRALCVGRLPQSDQIIDRPLHRHFFYGSTPATLQELTRRLSDQNPSLQVAGTLSPPFRSLTLEEDQHIVDQINASQPDIVWVGLGTPKQEQWMAEHVGRISGAVLVGVGAAFDFLSGGKRQAPYWIQKSGFEWLSRLATEPDRLWKRYLRSNPRFLALLVAQLTGLKRW